MKNREFYRDQIMNEKYEVTGENSFCHKFVRPYVLKASDCDEMQCSQCRMLQNVWLEEEYEEPEVDWSQVAVDTPILVRGCLGENGKDWVKRHFAKFENGVVYAWRDGATSWSENKCHWWNEAKLAEVGK